MSGEFFTMCERLLSAAANGLYQGLIIAFVVAVALRLFTRTNAATRYAIWFGTMLLIAALIPAHVLVSLAPHWRLDAANATEAETGPVVIPGPANPVNEVAWQVPDADYSPTEQIAADPANIPIEPQEEAASEPLIVERTIDTEPSDDVLTSPLPTVLKPFTAKPETFVNLPRWVCAGLICVWAILAGIRFAVIGARLAEVRRIKKSSQAAGLGLQALFDRICRAKTGSREVRLRISSAHRTAMLLGFAHPAVLLPAEMDKETRDGEVEHVLRHELAHVDRWDDWGNLAQQVIEGALHFHPAIWWISRQLSLEREIACDDHVIEASGRPRAYALTLANVAIRMNQNRHSLSPGVSNNNSQLQQRITMILNAQRDRSPRLARSRLGLFTATAAILAAIAINVGPRLVLAESASAETAAVAPDLSGPDTAPRHKDGESADVTVSQPVPEAVEAPEPPEPPEAPEAPEPPEPPEAPDALVSPAEVSVSVSPLIAPVHVQPRVDLVAPVAVSAQGLVTEVSMDSDEAPQPKREKRQLSVEERLDRLERKLDQLQARGDRKERRDAFAFKTDNQNWKPDGKPMDFNFKFDDDFKNSAEQIKREVEQAKREMEQEKDQAKREMEQEKRNAEQEKRNAEQMKRDVEQGKHEAEQAKREAEQREREAQQGKRDAERAMRQLEQQSEKRVAELQEKFRGMQFDGSEAQLEALKQARESLHHEVENLNEQIRHLEEQRNRGPKHVHKDDGDDGNKNDNGSSDKK
jgi:beta-lactamase regulating signal transducer with metallopeptidase domain